MISIEHYDSHIKNDMVRIFFKQFVIGAINFKPKMMPYCKQAIQNENIYFKVHCTLVNSDPVDLQFLLIQTPEHGLSPARQTVGSQSH